MFQLLHIQQSTQDLIWISDRLRPHYTAMIFLPTFATLCFSAMLAVSAVPSVHVEIDIPASYLGDTAVTTQVGGIHLHATHDERPGRVSNGAALASSNMDPTFEGCKPWDEVAIRNAIGDTREFVIDALK